MDSIIRFFFNAEGWIYFFAIIIGIICMINLLKAIHEKRLSIFGLELEVANRKIRGAVTGLVLMVIFAVSEFVFVIFTRVKFVGIDQLATPTVAVLSTPTISFAGGENLLEGTFAPGTAGGTAGESGCIDDQIEWTSPRPNEEVRGSIILKGTINVINLGFYKYDYRLSGDENWITISGGNQVIVKGQLGGEWDTSDLTPGEYQLRLLALDNDNKPFPECILQVTVVAP